MDFPFLLFPLFGTVRLFSRLFLCSIVHPSYMPKASVLGEPPSLGGGRHLSLYSGTAGAIKGALGPAPTGRPPCHCS